MMITYFFDFSKGFETVSYNLNGTLHHKDFREHEGKLSPGDLQWFFL
jgi:redox-sensitive bicupin YhaK (pirin superfamily)